MAFFFSSISSSIGKKLLLFALRQIDILDKDPADFVSVDVGKTTTLEVRNVGLHVKKLVALLHLKLPPEIRLAKAQASLFRITFVLEFGVPQITIEVDGVQVHARLSENAAPSGPRKPQSSPSPARPRASSPPASDYSSDASSEAGDDQIPTVDHLAQSFIREEPEEEIRELEEALNSQSENMQGSVASSEDGDDESTSGMGAPLGLPNILRNLLNTALDRLQIIVNHVDIEVEDQTAFETSEASQRLEDFPASVNFHIDQIKMDSVTSQDPKIGIASPALPPDTSSKLGRRRLQIENMYARLISDADNFSTKSQNSRSPSPVQTRSVASSSQKSPRDAPAHREVDIIKPTGFEKTDVAPPPSTLQPPIAAADVEEDPEPFDTPAHHETNRLASSVLTTDEYRFADAAAEDVLERSISSETSEHDGHSSETSEHDDRDMTSSSIFGNEGLLDYAMSNNLFASKLSLSASEHSGVHRPTHGHGQIPYETEPSTSHLPMLPVSNPSSNASGNSSPNLSQFVPIQVLSTDNLDSARLHAEEDLSPRSSPSHSASEEDLTESRLFTHDDAESMYMSAMSGDASNYNPAMPGGWESNSNSSQSAKSDTSATVPPYMVAGSILVPQPEADDGCETPRPSSPQSAFSSPGNPRGSFNSHTKKHGHPESGRDNPKLAKLFLTVDHVTVLFPLELGEDQPHTTGHGDPIEQPELSFRAPSLAQDDSIYQEMPGTFSYYANSSSRRKAPMNTPAPVQPRPNTKSYREDPPSQQSKKDASATISVEVGSIVGHIDISTGRIMFQLLDRIIKSIAGPPEPQKEKPKAQGPPPTSHSSLECSVRDIGIAWLERITTESVIVGQHHTAPLGLKPIDAIIRVNLSAVRVASQNTSQGGRAKIEIGKFFLSSLDQDVISFLSPKPRSRRSINTTTDLPASDIEIDFERAKESRITVVTRPVKVTFDLQRLDEALGSFGGFSGMLELGSSFSSSSGANSPTVSYAPPRPRGVHFGDAPLASPAPSDDRSNMPKIDFKFREVTLLLKGRSCAVQLHTATVRAAIRAMNIRLKVSEVKISGPYLDSPEFVAPLLMEVRDISIYFLFAPEEADLTKLISMITPSKDPYENDEDILVDTLLRQRSKGSVLRVEVDRVGLHVTDLEPLRAFEVLGAELAKLSKVTKYLPDDDRPGILTLASVQRFDADVMINERVGDISVSFQDAYLAHVGVPSLLAVQVGDISLRRGEELLIHEVVQLRQQDRLPMVMLRVVGDEMEPVIKAKLFNVCAEYHVSTIMAVLGLSDDGSPDDIAQILASSIATITGPSSPKSPSEHASESSSPQRANSKPLHVDLLLRSCAFGLNPRKIPSKALFVLTDAHFLGKQSRKKGISIAVELRKASIHAIDDIGRISQKEALSSMAPGVASGQRQLLELRESGYVSLSSIAAAKVHVSITGDSKDQPQVVEVEFKNELFVLESCADSTQTLIAILNGLQPPTPPSTAMKYRTVVPLQEMMESFTGDAMEAPRRNEDTGDTEFMENADLIPDEVPTNLEFVGSIYNQDSLPTDEDLGDSMLGEDDLGALATSPVIRQRGDRALLESFQEQYEVAEGEKEFNFDDNYFNDSDSERNGKARKWDSRKNRYNLTNEFKTPNAPLKVRVRDVNIVWNLFDGYDWPRTRNIISQAVENVEARAEERRQRPRDEDDDEDIVEQDYLFNSVWIAVHTSDENGALARRINHDIDDLASETGSYATSTASRSTNATIRPRSATAHSRRKLKLGRSKNKKMAFQLSGIAVDMIAFPPDSGETQNSINVRVRDFEVYDHVPSSTWNKFVTSMIQPSQREMARPMIDLELLTVKPVTELAASELVIRVTVLPLRLHVDQDALDFVTRFFEFKDDSAPENSSSSEEAFIQRLEVMAVALKLDYKPKRVDYRGLRSGHTTEFMNFLILDGADIMLRHAIVYGITDFGKLHKTLNDVWMPDVISNQLPSVLSGLAAVRPLVNVAGGVRDLFYIPMQEYKKDGRIVRSLQKGVYAFAKNTTSEVARLGAKVAIGTQNILEGADNFLNPQYSQPRPSSALHEWEDLDSTETDERRAVSNYAKQPIGVRSGLRSAARHLERDLLTARDAIIAIPTEIMEEGTGIGMARAVARHAPTVILRPALGATKAVSNALLGVGNALDKDSKRKIEDKYKSY